MASTTDVGNRLVALCRQKKGLQAVEELYAPNIVSIEAVAMTDPPLPRRMEGIADVKGKNVWWAENHDVHSAEAMGPFPHDDRFIVHYKFDVTAKDGPMKGKRMQIEEAALYTVKDGKIVQEEFFYTQ